MVCAAGGLQRLCQQTGMAEVLGERLLAWHLGAFGVLIPFLIAAVMKALQGSSLVASITTAGMVAPDPGAARSCRPQRQSARRARRRRRRDDLVAHQRRIFLAGRGPRQLTPLRGFAKFSAGTLLQGLIAAAALSCSPCSPRTRKRHGKILELSRNMLATATRLTSPMATLSAIRPPDCAGKRKSNDFR